jgi:hypothetical protein
MTPWRVEWSDVCVADVRRISWHTAGRICAAVLEYAKAGTGTVERGNPHNMFELRLRVPGAAAQIQLMPETRTIFVWRIYGSQ